LAKAQFKVPESKAPKEVRSIRLTPESLALLDKLAEAHGTNSSWAVEALIKAFAPKAIALAQVKKAARK